VTGPSSAALAATVLGVVPRQDTSPVAIPGATDTLAEFIKAPENTNTDRRGVRRCPPRRGPNNPSMPNQLSSRLLTRPHYLAL
jgi:hypothetical protein